MRSDVVGRRGHDLGRGRASRPSRAPAVPRPPALRAPARRGALRLASSARRWPATRDRPRAGGRDGCPGGPPPGVRSRPRSPGSARSPSRPATRPSAEGAGVPERIQQRTAGRPVRRAARGSRPDGRFLRAARLLEVRPQGRIARGQRLRRVERLRADLADVVDAHQRARFPALARRSSRVLVGRAGRAGRASRAAGEKRAQRAVGGAQERSRCERFIGRSDPTRMARLADRATPISHRDAETRRSCCCSPLQRIVLVVDVQRFRAKLNTLRRKAALVQ